MPAGLKPFFCYYGGKWRAAPHYPRPLFNTIIEPFAGAAGYSTRHHEREVVLYDVDPVIIGVWSYLVKATPAEILALPAVVDSVPTNIPQEAQWLIGFWLNKGGSAPGKTPSSWMRSGIRPASYWGPEVRERLADQVTKIRHWRIEQKAWAGVANQEATWFVDPPYQGKAGRHYRFNEIDFSALGAWCQTRLGQTIVCESEGADWLPFKPFRTIKASPAKHGGKRSVEVMWTGHAAPKPEMPRPLFFVPSAEKKAT